MKGAVAAGHPLTAEAGARALAEGGNAVDACVAAAFASWVAESPLTGPGAGGFALVLPADGRPARLADFFVATPGLGLPRPSGAQMHAIDVGFGGDSETTQVFRIGAASCAVPGTALGLAAIHRAYDYVLIDTPPSLGLLTINAFVASAGVIVPVQTEYLSLRGLVQLENTLQMVRENLNPRVEIVGIVPTMYDKRLTHSREADEILRENFGELVYNTRIRKTVRFAEAPVKGLSVLSYEPSGDAAALYRDLAKEVLDGQESRQHA